MNRPWLLPEQDYAAATAMARALGISPVTAALLRQRDVRTTEEAARFLRPSLKHLFDPFLMTDMTAAVERITLARDRQEKVLVFGDYDVDGVSAAALLWRGLRRFGIESVDADMPDRLNEGFGLAPEHVEQAAARGYRLIVTVDNGISALSAARRARELGVSLIVTDHHKPETELPDADAVINPLREPPDHPARGLCGAGVAFKLSTALNGTPNDLDLAALGTIADIVPLRGENRVIATFGLRHMQQHQRMGLRVLARVAERPIESVTSEDIGFMLAPRLNAAGRLEDARTALRLLLCEDEAEAHALARELDQTNRQRQEIEQAVYEDAVEEIDAWVQPDRCSIVVARSGWHPGVIGIVASRLLQRYQRPVFVLSLDEAGMARGSGRSGANFDLMAALISCADLFEKFGGHRAAAGLTMRADLVETFRERFEEAARAQFGGEPQPVPLQIDAISGISLLHPDLIGEINQLRPFGEGNRQPVLAAFGVRIVPGSVKVFKDDHVAMRLIQGRAVCSAIWFRGAERFWQGNFSGEVDVAFIPEPSTYPGDTPVRMKVVDIRVAEPIDADQD
ncbi:MAG TPA: single-stranded-DNA-specific exonuclease RecJ [Candidatus Hydrogenedentes bacterium]|nr:single-stranded-DNA-specific exonuclease RecJ [Candidatus Hydrogenedentota bacterium]